MLRRTKGQGSIRLRSDDRLEVRIMVGGRRRTRVLSKGATRQQAERVREELVRAGREGRLAVGGGATVATYLLTWLNTTGTSTLRPRSLERYRGIVERHVLPSVGHVRLERFSEQHVADLHGLWSQTVGQATVRYHHSVLRAAFREAVSRRLIDRNPMLGVHPPRRVRRSMQALSPQQTRRLLIEARGDRLEALYVVAVSTGLRLGELLALRWSDVDPARGRLTVQRTLIRLRGRWIVGEPKSTTSRRTVSLPRRATVALELHRARQIYEGSQARAEWKAGDLIFTDHAGRPLIGAHITERCLKPLLRRAGLPLIRFHDLRHTAATLLLGEGVHPKLVSSMLGHSSIELTLDTYSHVLPDMQERVAEAMDRALEGAVAVPGSPVATPSA